MNLTEQLEALTEDQIASVVAECNHLAELGIRPKFSPTYQIAQTMSFFTDKALSLDHAVGMVEKYCLRKAANLWLESRNH